LALVALVRLRLERVVLTRFFIRSQVLVVVAVTLTVPALTLFPVVQVVVVPT
jgi:hypothetical protein